MESLFKKCYNKVSYKILNKDFPCIEGHLFQPLSYVLIAHKLTSNVELKPYRYWTKKEDEIQYAYSMTGLHGIKDFFMVLDPDRKRIHFDISFINIEWIERDDILKKHFQLTRPSYKNNAGYTYTMKYNFRNCQKLVRMIRDLPVILERDGNLK